MSNLVRFWFLAVGLSVVALGVDRLGPEAWSATRVPITLAKYGPSVAGFVAAALWSDRGTLRRLAASALPTRASLPWLAAALALPTLVYFGALVVVAPGTALSGMSDANLLRGFIGYLGIRLFLGGGFGEEFGWRGWLLPTLARHAGPLVVVVSIGVAHGLWHAPASGIANAIFLCGITIPWSVVLAWLYFASGRSVLVCAVGHAAGNAWVPVLTGAAPSAAVPWMVTVMLMSWGLAAWALRRLRPLWTEEAP